MLDQACRVLFSVPDPHIPDYCLNDCNELNISNLPVISSGFIASVCIHSCTLPCVSLAIVCSRLLTSYAWSRYQAHGFVFINFCGEWLLPSLVLSRLRSALASGPDTFFVFMIVKKTTQAVRNHSLPTFNMVKGSTLVPGTVKLLQQ